MGFRPPMHISAKLDQEIPINKELVSSKHNALTKHDVESQYTTLAHHHAGAGSASLVSRVTLLSLSTYQQ